MNITGKGGFTKGHKLSKGRPKNSRNKMSLKLFNEFLDTISEVEQDEKISQGKSFFRHIIERSFKNDTLAGVVLKKLVPDKVYSELEFSGEGVVKKVKFELVSAEENKYNDKVLKRTT